MKFERSSGIILHISCLPSPDGIGDLGPEAYRWVEFLEKAGCHIWQVLPLGPTGYGDSPYQCFSAFAGNPYLISPTLLLENGLLNYPDLDNRPEFPVDHVVFGEVIQWKLHLLDLAYQRYLQEANSSFQSDLNEFVECQGWWLNDYALFMSIKENQRGASWDQWPELLRLRDEYALEEFRRKNHVNILRHIFMQYLFFQQWENIHKYAAARKVNILGDLPIFIAFDSADAWSHPELFHFDSSRRLKVVAGVPPDYFSPTGQLWGNPLYDWNYQKRTDYQWWIKRLKGALKLFDLIRLDHFRGFAGYWEVPAGMPTAETGRWVEGPGSDFLGKIDSTLGVLPIIAEDLGEITPDVIDLRDKFDLPGMKVLQFAFGSGPTNLFLPHNFVHNCVVYTGTHDNDTTQGWYEKASIDEKNFCNRYLGTSSESISWRMIRAAWSSIALLAIAPFQDFLELGSESRMNFPGRLGDNWTWRLRPEKINDHLAYKIKELNHLYQR